MSLYGGKFLIFHDEKVFQDLNSVTPINNNVKTKLLEKLIFTQLSANGLDGFHYQALQKSVN